jgi:hypothetical protein
MEEIVGKGNGIGISAFYTAYTTEARTMCSVF